MAKNFDEAYPPRRTTLALSHQNWRLFIGVVMVMLGMVTLFINLPTRNVIPSPPTTPIIIRDGLIVKGSGPALYLFKEHTLHRIVSPSAAQQAQAQPVADSFLTRYAHGEPVDANGLPIPQTQVNEQTPALQPSETTTRASATYLSLGGIVGVVVILAGGGWLLAQQFLDHQVNDQTDFKDYLQQTGIYVTQIQQVLEATPNHQQQQLLKQIHRWQQMIEALVHRIARLRQDELIHRDLANVPKVIVNLEQQLAIETQPTLRTHLEHTLTQRKNQLTALEALQTMIKQAEIQVETTVALLGTIYSQLLTHQSTSHVADYSSHLLTEVNEQIQCLQDHLIALQEVKQRH